MPFKDPEREFRSSRKLLKTLSLDESRSPESNLFSDLEEYSKEEVTKTMELRDNTFSGSDHEDANKNIEKVLELVHLFHILNITKDQVMLRAFVMSLTGVASRWLRNKPSGSITTWEDLKIKFLSKYCPPARTTKKIEEINNFQQEPDETLYQAASVSVMPLLTYLNLGLGELAHTKLTVELVDRTVKYPKRSAKNMLTVLSTAHTKIDVFKKKISVRVGDEKIIFKSFKPTSSLIKRVYMLSLRERMKLDLEVRLMGDTLVLNRSLDPLFGDYIKLNDLNVPLELMRDQVNDLIPTIKEGEVIDEPMIDIIKTSNNEGFDEYPSFCAFDRKIHIDCAYNLIFSCMIVVENIDGYRDQDMGDIILGEPFCKASCVEARRFDGLITIHNGSDNVTYHWRGHIQVLAIRRIHAHDTAYLAD
nr:hypothetical protein [Tanacetum cinerariifolium]